MRVHHILHQIGPFRSHVQSHTAVQRAWLRYQRHLISVSVSCNATPLTEPRLSFSIVLQTYVNTLQNTPLHLVLCCSRISFLLSGYQCHINMWSEWVAVILIYFKMTATHSGISINNIEQSPSIRCYLRAISLLGLCTVSIHFATHTHI